MGRCVHNSGYARELCLTWDVGDFPVSSPLLRFVRSSRTLPFTGIIRLHQYCEPLRLPKAAGLSLTGVRSIIPDHVLGPPVSRALSLCACCRHCPGIATGFSNRSSIPAVSALPDRIVGSACTSSYFEACSAFIRVMACTLALTVYRDSFPKGFGYLVTSIAKHRIFTAHTLSRRRWGRHFAEPI
jgi:hypothetical protein